MATVTSCTFDVILNALLTQLQAVTTFPAERCGASQTGDPETFQRQADQFILVRAGPQRPDPHCFTGRGRADPVFMRKVTVVLWTRANLDEIGRDLIHLTDAVLGHFPAEALLWDALSLFQPTDSNQNWLISQPITTGPCTEPVAGKGESEVSGGWLHSGLEFDVSYVLTFNQANSQTLGG
jgi:hypothetical protein